MKKLVMSFYYHVREIIVIASGIQAIRTDFDCLCPGQKITPKVFNFIYIINTPQ